MTNAFKNSVRVFPGEFPAIASSIRGRAVEVTCDRNCWNRDHWAREELLIEMIVFWLTLSETQPPTIIVNHDIDVIWVFERLRRAMEGRVVEVPFGRSHLPNEPVEIVSVFAIAVRPRVVAK